MAKISAVAKNNRREKLIRREADKRAKLKAVIMSKTSSDQEKFEAQIKLAQLPRDGSKIRYRNFMSRMFKGGEDCHRIQLSNNWLANDTMLLTCLWS